jgi:hypothetical protein
MGPTLQCLAIQLQAVTDLLEQFADGLPVRLVPHRIEFSGEISNALGSPRQWRHRVPARIRLNQPLQILFETWIQLNSSLASSARQAHPFRSYHPGSQLLDAFVMALLETPVAWETIVTPPRGNESAWAAATRRRVRSLSTDSRASNRILIPSLVVMSPAY